MLQHWHAACHGIAVHGSKGAKVNPLRRRISPKGNAENAWRSGTGQGHEEGNGHGTWEFSDSPLKPGANFRWMERRQGIEWSVPEFHNVPEFQGMIIPMGDGTTRLSARCLTTKRSAKMRIQHGLLLIFLVFLDGRALCQASAEAIPEGQPKSAFQPTTTWHRVSDATCPARMDTGLAAFNGKLWIIGGVNGLIRYFNDVWSTPDGVHWTQEVQHAPWAARSAPALAFNDKLWLLGGLGTPQINSAVRGDIWSSSDGVSWSQEISDVPWQADSGRANYRAVVFQDKLWIMGGDGPLPYLNDVWSSPDGTTWTCVTQHAAWSPRGGFALAVYDNRMWLMGGFGNSTELGDVWYTTDGATWVNASPKAWHPRMDVSAEGYNGALWAFGGWYTEGVGRGAHQVALGEYNCSTNGTDWKASSLPLSFSARPIGLLDGKLWFAGFPADENTIGYLSPVTVSITRDRTPLSHTGQALTLKLATTGFPDNITCQWLKDGTAIQYATTDTYHVDHIALADAGSYTCQVTDENGVVFTADPVPVAVSDEKVPAAGPAGLALGVCLTASVLVLRQRKSPHRSR